MSWSAIEDVTQVVKLKKFATELGLAAGDDKAAKWIGRIPGS